MTRAWQRHPSAGDLGRNGEGVSAARPPATGRRDAAATRRASPRRVAYGFRQRIAVR